MPKNNLASCQVAWRRLGLDILMTALIDWCPIVYVFMYFVDYKEGDQR